MLRPCPCCQWRDTMPTHRAAATPGAGIAQRPVRQAQAVRRMYLRPTASCSQAACPPPPPTPRLVCPPSVLRCISRRCRCLPLCRVVRQPSRPAITCCTTLSRGRVLPASWPAAPCCGHSCSLLPLAGARSDSRCVGSALPHMGCTVEGLLHAGAPRASCFGTARAGCLRADIPPLCTREGQRRSNTHGTSRRHSQPGTIPPRLRSPRSCS